MQIQAQKLKCSHGGAEFESMESGKDAVAQLAIT